MKRATQDWLRRDWLLVRMIENVLQRILGGVRFADDGEGLTCREQGMMRFQGTD